MPSIKPKNVKVADFRKAYDNLYRKANVHYHACVGADEVRNWKTGAQHALAAAISLKCSRAMPYDLGEMAKAIEQITRTIADADQRAATLNKPKDPLAAFRATGNSVTDKPRYQGFPVLSKPPFEPVIVENKDALDRMYGWNPEEFSLPDTNQQLSEQELQIFAKHLLIQYTIDFGDHFKIDEILAGLREKFTIMATASS